MSDLPETAIGTLRLFATTQTQVDKFSDDLIQSVKSGDANPIELLVMLKAFEKVSDRVLKEIRDNAITEAAKHPENIFEWNGNKIEKSELRVKYNYSICGDPEYIRLEAEATAAQDKLKSRQEFLKAVKEPMTIVDDQTGEVVRVIPPLRTSQTGLKVSIK